MLEFQEKKRIKRMFYSRPVSALLLLAVLFLGNVVWGMYDTYREARGKAELASAKQAELAARKAELEEKIARLETPRGQEEAIREKYLVAKEGESVIVLVDAPPATTSGSLPKKRGFWAGFFDLFR